MILCSTGTLTRGPDATDHHAILDHAAALPADGLELSVYEQRHGVRERGYEGDLTLEATAVDAAGRVDPARLAEISGALKALGGT